MSTVVKKLIDKNLKKLSDDMNKNISPIALGGVACEAFGAVFCALKELSQKSLIIISYDSIRAGMIYDDIRSLGYEAFYLDKREMMYYSVNDLSEENEYKRLATLNGLINNKDKAKILIMTVNTIDEELISPKVYQDKSLSLKISDEYEFSYLRGILHELGYERTEITENKGEYSMRGDILDIFPVEEDNPLRIEFYGDEIDSIRKFDKDSQRTIENIEEITISAAKEILILDEYEEAIVSNIRKDYIETAENNKSSCTIMSEKFEEYCELLENKAFNKNRSVLLKYIPDEYKADIFDYFNDDYYVFIDEDRRIKESYESYFKFRHEELLSLYNAGEILKSEYENILDYSFIDKKLKKKKLVLLNNILNADRSSDAAEKYKIHISVQSSYNRRFEEFIKDLEHYIYRGYKVIMGIFSEEKCDIIKGILDKNKIIYTEAENCDIKSGQILIERSYTARGFRYEEASLIYFTENDIFGSYKKDRKKVRNTKKINLSDIKKGDYIVHEDHGIGIYEGIVQLELMSVIKDFILLRYKGEDKLYIPVNQLDRIRKYKERDAENVSINKLSTNDWNRQKAKSGKAIEKMAKDLIVLYAEREYEKGYAFSKDSTWQKDFESSFPYEETEGQLRAIEEIKKDMEKSKPMDRLLCGDVGFGKTEVALRAAFKAVMDSKQVAILAPTTILAQQHYRTMLERFKNFPIRIDMMSRFRTSKEIKETAKAVFEGRVDIVSGTHRLLSDDVKFRDLGLLIIDEEQRFGVRAKDKIKKLKKNVDVLMLSATPIPRTMHMALAGIREMSIIEDPPMDRFPIQSYVVEYNDGMIREAILKEMDRNGQIYFVYNNVENIDKMYAHLKMLVPEADICVGHGQMSEASLEKVMTDFMDCKYDILLCTTIIETGLDIPNVNTIIVYDADKMGLSQLYQLRGRVGRSNRIAYGYFTYKENKVLSEVQEDRLKAIKEFQDLGSGYKIAMKDLEIRGAGNILGTSQHGHIAAIGYDLYIKYLNLAIKKLKGIEVEEEINSKIDINIDGYIPASFIKSTEIKLDIYKKIAAIENEEDKKDLIDEIVDRFGDCPYQLVNLMEISILKYRAQKLKIVNIQELKDRIKIEFKRGSDINSLYIKALYEVYKNRIKLDERKKPFFFISEVNEDKILEIGKILSIIEKAKAESTEKKDL